MSVIPEEILSKLICSSCKKYLSVFPVTVYYNKNVLCGRCSAETTNGTRSSLYELVAEAFVFPCINRFGNCRQVLTPSEITGHENACISREYGCQFCVDYMGTPYDLLYHMKISHKSADLGCNSFYIEIDKLRNSDAYFYCINNILIVVGYDLIDPNLCVYVNVIGDNNENMMHKFGLYTVQNEVQYATGNIVTSKWNKKGININISEHKYPGNIIFCKFDVWIAAVHLDKYNFNKENAAFPVLDGSRNSAVMKFTFGGISQMQENTCVYSKVKYFVANEAWLLFIGKSTTNKVQCLKAFLRREGVSDRKLKVSFILSLLSHSDQKKTISWEFCTPNMTKDYGWANFTNWDNLLNPRYGFVEDDSIKFDAKIDVLPSSRRKSMKVQKSL